MNKYLCQGTLIYLLGITLSSAGVSLDSSRIIFNANDSLSGVSVGITSSESSLTSYLVKAQISLSPLGEENNANTPFIVTPSLFRLEPNNTQSALIIKKNQDLPEDRESIFYFRATAIPSEKSNREQTSHQVGGALKVAGVNVIKLFYRPSGLLTTQSQSMANLVFSSEKHAVKINNPSPYYVTFNSLKINNIYVDLDNADAVSMIAPFSSVTYKNVPTQGAIEWKAINDYGAVETFNGELK